MFESVAIPDRRKNLENRSNVPEWVLPAAIAGAGGLIGLGWGYKYYQAEQLRKKESMDRLRERILSRPEEDIFGDNIPPEIKQKAFIKIHGYNINDALSKIKPQETMVVDSSASKNNNVDSDDQEINDLVSAAQQI